jgi:biotin carboxylase
VLLLTGIAYRHYPYRLLDPVGSLETAVVAAAPDLIVPCDEPATADLQQLAERAAAAPHLSAAFRAIESSLGSAANLKKLTERAYVLKAAADGGAVVPASAAVANTADLRAWLSANGFPAYLKADGTFAALGVRQVHTYEEAEAAFRALHAPPRAMTTVNRMVFHRDPSLLIPLFARHRPAISVQRSVPGVDVNSTIFCWRGRVLASLNMQVVTVRYRFGPSTVLRRIHNAGMDRTAEILAARLNLSGFYGLDFILEEQTGIAWLLEMNSRATQIPHLALGPGHDLPAAAFAAITGLPVRPRPPVTNEATIALFPQEWNRDPASPLIRSAYHDVPWESPTLVRACISQPLDIRRLVSPATLRRLISPGYWRQRKQQKLSVTSSVAAEIASRLS